jgi:signal transduction histidine kinase
MIVIVLLVAAGQCYWLMKQYDDEYENLKTGMDAQFRSAFFTLQRTRFLQDTVLFTRLTDSTDIPKRKRDPIAPVYKKKQGGGMILELDSIGLHLSKEQKSINDISPEQIKSIRMVKADDQAVLPPELMEVFIIQAEKKRQDIARSGDGASTKDRQAIRSLSLSGVEFQPVDSDRVPQTKNRNLRANAIPPDINISSTNTTQPVLRMFSNNKTLNDSIPLHHLEWVFRRTLSADQQSLDFTLVARQWNRSEMPRIEHPIDTLDGFISSMQMTGFKRPYTYQILIRHPRKYLLQQMTWQIISALFTIMLMMLTSFFIYHTLRRQQRLAEMKNAFISNITHELKTPISTVNVALEALQRFNVLADTQKTREYLEISRSELDRLQMLVDNVLKQSMLEHHVIELELIRLDLRSLVEAVMQDMRLQFDKTSAEVQLKIDGDSFFIQSDRLHMSSVIFNLLDNALKYSQGNPHVEIELKRGEDYIYLHVSDHGIGIPAAFHGKIFRHFFRVPTEDHHNVKGHGLGLSYVAHIIKMHNGQIRVINNLYGGTLFTIQLPAA